MTIDSEGNERGEGVAMCRCGRRRCDHAVMAGRLVAWGGEGLPRCDNFSPAEARIYERGGYMAIDSRGIEAVRRSLPGLGFDAITDAVSRKWEAEVSATFASRPSGPIVGLAATLTPPTPAAMLGEALIDEAARRADAPRQEGYIQGIARCMGVVAEYGGDMVPASDIYERLGYLKREAEARTPSHPPCPRHGAWCSGNHTEKPPAPRSLVDPVPNSCWQCDASLGATEACLTCAAKRREGGK